MKPENAIEVKDITKSFKVFMDRGNTIKERALFSKRRKYDYRQVLNGIGFEVKKGEAIGLVGHNGCGKSTTLKLLTKIIYPDSGEIEIEGRVSSLIELGAGFHPDMSGRENIYINASIFGLGRKEIDRRLDDIIAFSELEDFMDNPVRTYSSGMYMRLAFSVAINVDADVLLIDEILGVGDANFQAKCFNKLREIKAKGTTIVIVSHSLGQIEQICERSLWIHNGEIRKEGEPREVHPIYLDYMGNKRVEIAEKEAARQAEKKQETQPEEVSLETVPRENEEERAEGNLDVTDITENSAEMPAVKRWGNGKARITQIEVLDNAGKVKNVFETGSDIKIRLHYHAKQAVEDAVIGIGIFRNDGTNCYGTNTRIDKMKEFDLSGSGQMELSLQNVLLLPGEYLIDFAIESGDGVPVDYYREAVKMEFYSGITDVGVVRMQHKWML